MNKLTTLTIFIVTIFVSAVGLSEDETSLRRKFESLFTPQASKHIPDRQSVNCEEQFNFYYTQIYKGFDQDFAVDQAACSALKLYDTHVHETLNAFYPSDELYGLQITPAKDVLGLNGIFKPRPILNQNNVSQFTFYFLEGLSLDLNIPIWTHEYGHAVFEEAIQKYFFSDQKEAYFRYLVEANKRSNSSTSYSEIQETIARLERYENLEQIRQKHSVGLQEVLNRKKISLQVSQLNLAESVLKNRAAIESNMKLSMLTLYSSVYHEFFADVFAGLFHRDVNIIGNTFDSLSPEFKGDLRKMKVSAPVDISSWKFNGSHTFFTPTRHRIGSALEIVIQKKKARLFLERLASALMVELNNIASFSDKKNYVSYGPIIRKVSQTKKSHELITYLRELAIEGQVILKFNSEYLERTCQHNFRKCKTFTLKELRKRHRGIIKAMPKVSEANRRLITIINEIADKI